MMKISSRDKKLIIFMLVLLLAYGIFNFVYKPVINSLVENSAILASDQEQQTTMVNALSRYGVQDETINELSDNINERLSTVSKYQVNEDIEDYLISLSKSLNIDFTSISYSDYEVAQMNAILDESLLQTTDSTTTDETTTDETTTDETTTDETTTDETTTDTELDSDYNLKKYACTLTDCSDTPYISEVVPLVMLEKKMVTINFDTTADSYKSFIDKINEDKKTMLISQSSDTLNDDGSESFTIALDIYSIKGW